MSQIEQKIPARQRDIGSTPVRRSLPYAKRRMVGPFIFWDHIGPLTVMPEAPIAVRAHPHIGLSTLTYLFTGELLHRDSLGNEARIRPGEVNWMSAGRGIAHSERSVADTPMALEGIQLWVALPKPHEAMSPQFQHVDTLPEVTLDGQVFSLLAGEFNGQRSPVSAWSPLLYLDGEFAAQNRVTVPTPAGFEMALYVARGSVRVDNDRHDEGDMLVFRRGEAFTFHAEAGSRVLIIGGEPLAEPRHIWWNFVASDPQLIEQAKDAWRQGLFDPVIGESDPLPLPEP